MVGNGVVVLEEAMMTVMATVCYIDLTLGFSEARPFTLDVRVDFWATFESDRSWCHRYPGRRMAKNVGILEEEGSDAEIAGAGENSFKHLNLRVTARVCINEYNPAA